MAKTPPNSRKHWTPPQEKRLRELVKHGKPTPLIGWYLGRSTDAIYKHAAALNLSLHPTNKSPDKRHRRR